MKKNYLLLSFSLFFILGIINAQKVGVNTSSPTKMLDVNGNARIRSITTDNTAPNIIVADNQGNIGSISKTSLLSSEVDGVIGNEVTKANNGLQITGSGTTSDPLTVGIANAGVTASMLNQMSATSGQTLKWNGTNWVAANDEGIRTETNNVDVAGFQLNIPPHGDFTSDFSNNSNQNYDTNSWKVISKTSVKAVTNVNPDTAQFQPSRMVVEYEYTGTKFNLLDLFPILTASNSSDYQDIFVANVIKIYEYNNKTRLKVSITRVDLMGRTTVNIPTNVSWAGTFQLNLLLAKKI